MKKKHENLTTNPMNTCKWLVLTYTLLNIYSKDIRSYYHKISDKWTLNLLTMKDLKYVLRLYIMFFRMRIIWKNSCKTVYTCEKLKASLVNRVDWETYRLHFCGSMVQTTQPSYYFKQLCRIIRTLLRTFKRLGKWYP